MFELLCMSLLTVAWIYAKKEEKIEEEKRKEKERTLDLRVSVFCYAVGHNLLYNQVVEMIRNNQITIEDIRKDNDEYEGK